MDRKEEQKETPLKIKKKRESEHVTNTDEYLITSNYIPLFITSVLNKSNTSNNHTPFIYI